MKKKHILLSLCLVIDVVIIAQLLLSNDPTPLSKNYLKIASIILNVIIVIRGCSFFMQSSASEIVPLKTIIALIITIVANLYFGVYLKEYFYLNIALLPAIIEFFIKKA